MMYLYEKVTYDIQRYIQWLEISFEDEHLVPYVLFTQIEDNLDK